MRKLFAVTAVSAALTLCLSAFPAEYPPALDNGGGVYATHMVDAFIAELERPAPADLAAPAVEVLAQAMPAAVELVLELNDGTEGALATATPEPLFLPVDEDALPPMYALQERRQAPPPRDDRPTAYLAGPLERALPAPHRPPSGQVRILLT